MLDTHFNAPDQNKSPILPHTAIILFGNHGDDRISGATRHTIKDAQMGLGEYISPNEVVAFFAKNHPQDLTINTPNLVAENDKHLVWYAQSCTKRMWFRVAGSKPLGLEVTWPTLLFVADKISFRLNVYALADDAFPTMDTDVYHAPLMNINGMGNLCLGSAKLPDIISKETMQEIEDTIYDSNFTHVNHRETLQIKNAKKQCDTKTHLAFWKKKAKSKSPVSKKELVKHCQLRELACFGGQK